jgi:hypothetical protein
VPHGVAAQRHIHHQSPMPVMVVESGIIKKLSTAIAKMPQSLLSLLG